MQYFATPFAVVMSIVYLAPSGRIKPDQVRLVFQESLRKHEAAFADVEAAFAASGLGLGQFARGGGRHTTAGIQKSPNKIKKGFTPRRRGPSRKTKTGAAAKPQGDEEGDDEDAYADDEDENGIQATARLAHMRPRLPAKAWHEEHFRARRGDESRRRQWRREATARQAEEAYGSYCEDIDSVPKNDFLTTDQKREFVESANTQLAEALGNLWPVAPAKIQNSEAFKIVLKNVQSWANAYANFVVERRKHLTSLRREFEEMEEPYSMAKMVRSMAASKVVARAADAEVEMVIQAGNKLKAEYVQLQIELEEAKVWVAKGRDAAKKVADESFLEGLLRWLQSSEN